MTKVYPQRGANTHSTAVCTFYPLCQVTFGPLLVVIFAARPEWFLDDCRKAKRPKSKPYFPLAQCYILGFHSCSIPENPFNTTKVTNDNDNKGK
jgi:hypothetical protein